MLYGTPSLPCKCITCQSERHLAKLRRRELAKRAIRVINPDGSTGWREKTTNPEKGFGL